MLQPGPAEGASIAGTLSAVGQQGGQGGWAGGETPSFKNAQGRETRAAPLCPTIAPRTEQGREEQISYENYTLAFPLRRTLTVHSGGGLADTNGC